MATRSNRAIFVCDACMDRCADCGQVKKDLHKTSSFPPICNSCASAYNNSKCVLCGGKLGSTKIRVHRCAACAKEDKKCFKCGTAFK
ncbi:hypothetical protein M9Y10_036624 [Tritrichomonas musculus]|uniref:Uncharacterized protein n=1 Tax=Tritrichomonas musculus TaxID=1915356 RepID=A0ABR2GU68_9EUKA